MVAKAVVIFSGGLDSSTCLAMARSQGYEVYAMSFHYGQKHAAELQAAKRIALHEGVKEHRILELSPQAFQGSSLTDQAEPIPDHHDSEDIPSTYVPARNTIFIAYALGWAEVLNAEAIYIGVSHVDYSGYPDCRPAYIDAYQHLIGLATARTAMGQPIRLVAPLMHLSKAETVALGTHLGVDYSLTVSCYAADQDGRACGRCDSCVLRRQGFLDAQLEDPTRYQP